MRLSRLCFLAAFMSIAPRALADCGCPLSSSIRTPILSTGIGTAGAGLVVCGHQDEVRGLAIVASELQIFRCDRERPLLEFDALRTVVLRTRGDSLNVVEMARWPFGKDWQWVEVPLYEWTLIPDDVREERRILELPAPRLAAGQIRKAVSEYEEWLTVDPETRDYGLAEQFVARLFVAAVTGDAEATVQFLAMPDRAGLDGAVAEIYGDAREIYDIHHPATRRLRKE